MRNARFRILAVGISLALMAACESAAPSTPAPPFSTVTPQDKADGRAGGLVIKRAGVQLLESYPVQVRLAVEGTLPTPCYGLQYQVSEPDKDGRIDVSLHAVPGEEEYCDQVITPFEETIPIGSFAQGALTVWLNGEQVDEFDLGGAMSPSTPGKGAVGPVFVERTGLLMMESDPVQVVLTVEGHVPTPCHELRWQVSKPDSAGRIEVEMFSISDPDTLCIQVLEAFMERIPLGSFESGSFSVWLNGVHVGDFEL
jgi:hypothetical protein